MPRDSAMVVPHCEPLAKSSTISTRRGSARALNTLARSSGLIAFETITLHGSTAFSLRFVYSNS